MLESTTGSDVANEIRMMRTVFKGAVLLTEGATDARFFQKFTSADTCSVIPAHGKGNTLRAMEVLETEHFEGVIAIVDADFWHILSPPGLPANVYMTDCHDIEVMILEANALDNFLNEYGSAEKIRAFLQSSTTTSIRQALYNISFPVGLLRLVGEKRRIPLRFEGLRYDRIVCRRTLEIDTNRLIRNVLRLSQNPLTDAEAHAALEEEKSLQGTTDPCQVCCGPDVVAIMGVGLRRAIGSLDATTADVNNITRILRLAYDSGDLRETTLYRDVKEWESDNQPYRVFDV